MTDVGRRRAAARAGGEGGISRRPLRGSRADATIRPVLDVGVDHAAPAAIVSARAGDDLFARGAWRRARFRSDLVRLGFIGSSVEDDHARATWPVRMAVKPSLISSIVYVRLTSWSILSRPSR